VEMGDSALRLGESRSLGATGGGVADLVERGLGGERCSGITSATRSGEAREEGRKVALWCGACRFGERRGRGAHPPRGLDVALHDAATGPAAPDRFEGTASLL